MKKEWREMIGREKGLVGDFLNTQGEILAEIGEGMLGWVGDLKTTVAKLMYRQRGRFSGTFVHATMAGLVFAAVMFSAKIEELVEARDNEQTGGTNYLLMGDESFGGAETQLSGSSKGEITEYRVKEGDTISSIALRYGVSIDTIVWENNLKAVDAIKPNQIIRILPATGIKYKVKRGETVYSIAKATQVDAQNIIDYPFNTFANDETFALTAGQELFVPEGIKPKEVVVDQTRYLARTVAPIPGVVGEGSFMWPTTGKISQRYYWYHQGADIANAAGPDVVASQGGTVVTAGWSGGGYGNFVVIDHGNGYKTLYAHMANGSIAVEAGKKVTQGQKLGRMGSTGRSTGTHLHFEIIGARGKVDPLAVLK